MHRTTRVHTIARHLTLGGLTDLRLTEAQQKELWASDHDTDGFALRQHQDMTGTRVVVAAAYGPDWFTTLREIRHRLEQPYVKCTVLLEAPELDTHEVLVRWATSAELRNRKRARAQAQAPLVALLRKQVAETRAATERQALEDAGQPSLW